MMDNRTTNNVGQFYWWFGVVENRDDPLRMGRCRVRIMGYHIENKEILPTEDLPWAFPIMPANNPSISGTGTSSNGVVPGTWVVGFFADGSDGQHPMFFGTVGAVPGGPYPDPCAPAGGNSASDGASGDSPASGGGVEPGQDTPITSGPPQQEFWTLVAMCAMEAGLNKPQGQADVAQSIYNRAASGAYGSKNILGIMLAKGQYESSWRYPSRTGGDSPNGFWRNITDARTAAMACGKGFTVTHMQQVSQNIKNAQMQVEAKRFIGPRTDFLGSNQPAKAMTANGTKVQRDGKSNKFGFSYNYKGRALGNPPASVTSGG